MTTGRRLPHQRLATWQIATFSEIVSHQYAMAYDNVAQKVLPLTFSLRLCCTIFSHDELVMSQEQQQHTKTPENTLTMAAEPLATPAACIL
jgi:hypothetical protein